MRKGSTMRLAVTYTYDEADQLIADSEGCSYSYNGTGELTGKEKDGHSTQYTWDGKGRLSAIIEPGGETSTFFHDPYDRTLAYMRGEEGQVFIHSLKTDKEIATLDMQMGLSSLYSAGADGLISTTSSSETSYASFNPHSDLALTTDASGIPTSQLHYDAWGNCAEESQEPFGYLGKWQRRQHESDGLIKMGARYYDPGLGRFISKDPLGGNSVVPSATNVYAYANNNPVGMLDLNGLAATGEGNPSVACTIADQVDPNMESANATGILWQRVSGYLPGTGYESLWLRTSVSYQAIMNDPARWLVRWVGCRVRADFYCGPYTKEVVNFIVQVFDNGRMISSCSRVRTDEVPFWDLGEAQDYGPGASYPDGKELAYSHPVWKKVNKGYTSITAGVAWRVNTSDFQEGPSLYQQILYSGWKITL